MIELNENFAYDKDNYYITVKVPDGRKFHILIPKGEYLEGWKTESFIGLNLVSHGHYV